MCRHEGLTSHFGPSVANSSTPSHTGCSGVTNRDLLLSSRGSGLWAVRVYGFCQQSSKESYSPT